MTPEANDLPVGPAGEPAILPPTSLLAAQALAPVHPQKAHNIKKAVDKLMREANRYERRGHKLLERGKSYVAEARQLQAQLDQIHKAVAAQAAPQSA